MLANRFSKSFAVLLMLAIALVSVSFVTRPGEMFPTANISKQEAGYSDVVSNTYLPLPPGRQTQLYNAARGSADFYQRHNDWSWPVAASVEAYLDYAQRHPELSLRSSLGQGASDYAERHPELSAQAVSSVDLTDYYFRHLNN